MAKNILMNEIKLIELKLNLLKTKIASEELKIGTTADLYGLLKNSEDITNEDIEAIKIKLKMDLK